jgi:hypothetical protein
MIIFDALPYYPKLASISSCLAFSYSNLLAKALSAASLALEKGTASLSTGLLLR